MGQVASPAGWFSRWHYGCPTHARGTGKTNSFPVQAIKRWLGDPDGELKHNRLAIASPDLRRAILSAPFAVQRAAFGVLTGRRSELVAEGFGDTFLNHLTDTYTKPDAMWGETWVGVRHEQPRALLAYLSNGPISEGICIQDVARHLSAPFDTVVAWGSERPFPGPRANGRPRRRSIIDRTWRRGDHKPVEDRRLMLRKCPHSDCPGRGSNAKAPAGALRATPLTHYLWVPELLDGLLCPDCRCMPSDRTVVFPSIYLELWNKGRLASGTSRSEIVIDPS